MIVIDRRPAAFSVLPIKCPTIKHNRIVIELLSICERIIAEFARKEVSRRRSKTGHNEPNSYP